MRRGPPAARGSPRGCLDDLRELLAGPKVDLELDDRRELGSEVDFSFNGELTELQNQAASALLEADVGVSVAPPGIGKTVVGTYLVAARRRSTLILTHRKPLLEQWVAQLSLFLGIEPKTIGQIGGGKSKETRRPPTTGSTESLCFSSFASFSTTR